MDPQDKIKQIQATVIANTVKTKQGAADVAAEQIKIWSVAWAAFVVLCYQMARSAKWLWDHFFYYIYYVLSRPFVWNWKWFRFMWRKMVAEDFTLRLGTGQIARGGLLILIFGSFVWYAEIPIARAVGMYGLYVATVKHDEPMKLTQSQEIDPEGDVWNVRGCEQFPCTDDNANNYRISPYLFHHIHSVVTHNFDPTKIFFPDFVAAAIPTGPNNCKITTYGIRRKFFVRGFDIYPFLLKVTCQPMRDN